jgi:hypothetical protein
MAKQWIDYKQGTDTGYENSDSIQPVADGESANQTVFRRPSENLRQRTEIIRDSVEENLYLRDVDRALTVWGGGNIAWNGTSTVAGNGKFTITADLYVAPITGIGDSGATPEIASAFGTLTLQRVGPANGLTVTSKKRNYEGGDKISVEIILDNAIGGNTDITVAGTPANKIQIKVKSTTTLNQVITDVAANVTANALVGMALAGGAASGDIILSPQAEQYIQGNWDSELHVITSANLASFFTTPANVLEDGDALCIWYNNNVEGTVSADTSDPKGGVLGGRRESIVENSNYTIPAGSLFNSRVNPERLPNCIPVCRAVEGGTKLKFIDGSTFAYGATASPLGSTGYALKTDLASTASGKGASTIGIEDAGTVFTATTVEGALAELDSDITTLSGNTTAGLALKVAKAGDTMTGNLVPNVTGLDLGSGAAFWDAYLNVVTLNNNVNPVTDGGASIGNTNKLAVLGTRRVVVDNSAGTSTNYAIDVTAHTSQDTNIAPVIIRHGTADAVRGPILNIIGKQGNTNVWFDEFGYYRPRGRYFVDNMQYSNGVDGENAFDGRWAVTLTGTASRDTTDDGYVQFTTGSTISSSITAVAASPKVDRSARPLFRAVVQLTVDLADRTDRIGIENVAYFERQFGVSNNWYLVTPGGGASVDLGFAPTVGQDYIYSLAITADGKIDVLIHRSYMQPITGAVDVATTVSTTISTNSGHAFIYTETQNTVTKSTRVHSVELYSHRIITL